MKEKQVWKILKRYFAKHSARANRIENLIGSGFPDVNFCLGGFEGWIEIKAPKAPKKAKTKLFGSNHKLSQEQKNWFLEQIKAGGKCYIFIAIVDQKKHKAFLLVHGKHADIINDLNCDQLFELADWVGISEELKGLKDVLVWGGK